MKLFLRTFILVASFVFSQSFMRPMLLKKSISVVAATKYNFNEFTTKISVPDKYFLIQSFINHIVLQKPDLLFDYCYKNLNETNVMHITISRDLEYMVKKHYNTKSILELFDTISSNAELTDCYMKIYTTDDLNKKNDN